MEIYRQLINTKNMTKMENLKILLKNYLQQVKEYFIENGLTNMGGNLKVIKKLNKEDETLFTQPYDKKSLEIYDYIIKNLNYTNVSIYVIFENFCIKFENDYNIYVTKDILDITIFNKSVLEKDLNLLVDNLIIDLSKEHEKINR